MKTKTQPEAKLASAFKLNNQTWLQHANPLSVYTRFTILPLLSLTIWSRVWLGWEWALGLTALVFLWTYLNPRAFKKPKTTKNWASKLVLGERVWLNRKQIPIPKHHQTAAILLASVSAPGLVFYTWGLVALNFWMMMFGLSVIFISKLWFVDRMVWLLEDMAPKHEEYRKWIY